MLPAFYTPFYCEENIWHLCQDARFAAAEPHVAFISNASGRCAFWAQRAAPRSQEPLLWDYHVVLIARAPAPSWHVWDCDTRLPFPIDATTYLARTFPAEHPVPARFRPHFRLAPASDFVAVFASDRSHMRTREGQWTAPPPAHPPIRTASETMNLARFVDVTASFVGDTMDLPSLRAWLAARG